MKIYIVWPEAFCDDAPEAFFLDYRKAAYYCLTHTNNHSRPCIEAAETDDDAFADFSNFFINLECLIKFDENSSTYDISHVGSTFSSTPNLTCHPVRENPPYYHVNTSLPITHPFALPDYHNHALADAFWAYKRDSGDPAFQSLVTDYSLFGLPAIPELQKNNQEA